MDNNDFEPYIHYFELSKIERNEVKSKCEVQFIDVFTDVDVNREHVLVVIDEWLIASTSLE